jgi:hypothetical protein
MMHHKRNADARRSYKISENLEFCFNQEKSLFKIINLLLVPNDTLIAVFLNLFWFATQNSSKNFRDIQVEKYLVKENKIHKKVYKYV